MEHGNKVFDVMEHYHERLNEHVASGLITVQQAWGIHGKAAAESAVEVLPGRASPEKD